MTIHRNETPTVAEQVASLEEGYAALLMENKNLGEQQEITRQAYQNLLAEKDADLKTSNEIIMARDRVIQAKLKHIERLDEALNHAKECNDRLDHQLELAHRPTATSVRIEGQAPPPTPLTYGDVKLAWYISNSIHHQAIRVLLGVEACRMLDTAIMANKGVSD